MKRRDAIIIAVVICVMISLLIYFRMRENATIDTEEEMTPTSCPMGSELINGKCLTKCKEGFEESGNLCIEKCHEGETDDGSECKTSEGKTRTKVVVDRVLSHKTIKGAKTVECDKGFHSVFGHEMCAEDCSSNNYVEMMHMCVEPCPSGTLDMGVVCTSPDGHIHVRDSYIPRTILSKDFEGQNALPCAVGTVPFPDMICLSKCKEGYTQKGGLCIENCKSDETDLGAVCLKGQVTRRKDIGITSYGPRTILKSGN